MFEGATGCGRDPTNSFLTGRYRRQEFGVRYEARTHYGLHPIACSQFVVLDAEPKCAVGGNHFPQ